MNRLVVPAKVSEHKIYHYRYIENNLIVYTTTKVHNILIATIEKVPRLAPSTKMKPYTFQQPYKVVKAFIMVCGYTAHIANYSCIKLKADNWSNFMCAHI